jgi:hypothetical protein
MVIESTSATIVFKSYYTEYGTAYDIDQSTNLSAITITTNAYGTFTASSATRVDSSVMNEVTNVDFSATSLNPIPVGSKITVNIPIAQFVLNVGSVSDVTFYQLDSSGNVGTQRTPSSTPTSNSTYYIFEFTEWCSSGSSCPAGSENIKFRATGFKNPSSPKPTSDSIMILVNSGSLKVDSVESGLIATPSIQAGPLTDVTVTRDTNVVGGVTTYTI